VILNKFSVYVDSTLDVGQSVVIILYKNGVALTTTEGTINNTASRVLNILSPVTFTNIDSLSVGIIVRNGPIGPNKTIIATLSFT
jgi:DUF1009 family protein